MDRTPMSLVLVVDDEADVRLVARVILASAGHEVVEADSGEAAMTRLDKDAVPDVVLLDIRMPGIDGWDLLGRIRDHPRHHALPVVVFTAHVTARGEAPPRFRDYEHFLTKPFKPDELLAAVDAALAS
jgi:two-component system response regulator GlrR